MSHLPKISRTWLYAAIVLALPGFDPVARSQDSIPVPLVEVGARVARGEKPRIRAVVTCEIIRGYLFVADESGALCLMLADSKPFARGDLIEATIAGYNARDFWHVAATAEKVGTGEMPAAMEVRGTEISVARHHASRLSSVAKVTGHSQTTRTYMVDRKAVPLTYEVILTECDGLPVRLCFDLGSDLRERCPEGALVRFTGAARVHEIKDWAVNPYVAIWVDDPAWIEVIALPSFFERKEVRRALRIGGVVLAGLVALAIFGAILQRRHLRHLRRRNEELERHVAERTEELREALERERKLGLVKSDFVSLVSHEFRTPLGVILSATEILLRYFDRLDPEKRERHLEMIRSSTGNLAGMIDEVLLLGRMEDGKLTFSVEPLDLRLFPRVIVDELISATHGTNPIDLDLVGDLDGARGDEALMRHIFGNLLSNACKYSLPGERVRFEIVREGDEARFAIEDRGIGIPEEDRERLFTSFSRGSNVGMLPGTGLGLVIVKRCVEMHGGRFQLDSAPGNGTTATVWLPLFVTEMAPSAAPEMTAIAP